LAAEMALFGNQPEARDIYDLDSAFQGKEALELVPKACYLGLPYAMAFIDVRMPPGWDGVETTFRILEADPEIQVVICTAYSDYSWDKILEKLGRSDRVVILKKPFDNVGVLQMATSLTMKWQLIRESKTKTTELEKLILQRTAQFSQEKENSRVIFENSPDGILQATRDGRILNANPALAAILGYESSQDFLKQITDFYQHLYPDLDRRVELKRQMHGNKIVRNFESEMRCKDGSRKWTSLTACQVTKPDGSSFYHVFLVDTAAQRKLNAENDLIEPSVTTSAKT
jgi:PAS domain S-box-containing protein